MRNDNYDNHVITIIKIIIIIASMLLYSPLYALTVPFVLTKIKNILVKKI